MDKVAIRERYFFVALILASYVLFAYNGTRGEEWPWVSTLVVIVSIAAACFHVYWVDI
jgi:hypothetical protein